LVVGVIDEISSIMYSNAGTDAIIVSQGESRFTLDFLVDFVGGEILPEHSGTALKR
jgi:hypothetical protein